jgi:hypothetical protein
MFATTFVLILVTLTISTTSLPFDNTNNNQQQHNTVIKTSSNNADNENRKLVARNVVDFGAFSDLSSASARKSSSSSTSLTKLDNVFGENRDIVELNLDTTEVSRKL